MRRFLWSGGTDITTGAKVAWENVCKPKKEGGLGLKSLTLLNYTLNIKHVWGLLSNQNRSIWASWIHTYRLRGKSFWAIKAPSQFSWYWMKLLKMRDKIRPLLKHNIGNGCRTFLWFDNWHPLGPILEKFGNRIVYDSAIPLHAKVNVIIAGGEWHWPRTNTLELMEVRSQMHLVDSPSEALDTVCWIPSPSRKFSTHHTWDYLCLEL